MGKTAGPDFLQVGEIAEFASGNDPVIRARVKGDAFERLRIEADGTVLTGDGATAPATEFGATLTAQSITGTTEQEQIDSVVTALVALGLGTDDR